MTDTGQPPSSPLLLGSTDGQQLFNGSQVAALSTLDHIQWALFQGDATRRQINWALAIVFTLVMLATAVGNLFVIIAILVERNLRSVGNYLVLSLATADLLVALAVMPLASVYQILDAWTLGVWLCEFWTSSDVFSCTASILHLLAIALDRYWAVTRVDYIRCQRNERHILCMIAIVWITALIISLAPFFGWMDDNFESRITGRKECLVSQDVSYQVLATCATFFIPVSITLVLYWKIYQVARKRIRRKPGNRLKVSQQLPSSSSSGGGGPQSPYRKQGSNERLSSSVAVHTGATGDSFCVCSCHQLASGSTGINTSPLNSPLSRHFSAGAPSAGAAHGNTRAPVDERTTTASDTTVRLEDVGNSSSPQGISTSNNQTCGQSLPVQVTLNQPASSLSPQVRRENCCEPDDCTTLNLSLTGGSPTKQQLIATIDSRGAVLQNELEAPPEKPESIFRDRLLGWLKRRLFCVKEEPQCTTTGRCYLCAEFQLQQPHSPNPRLALTVTSHSATVETVAATTANLATSALRPPLGQVQNSIQFHSTAQEGIESKRERKAAKTLAIITGIFVICWLPFFSMALAMPLLDLQPPKYLFNLLMWLGYVNSMLNPIIYTIFSPDFRRAFKRLLCGASNSRPSHQRHLLADGGGHLKQMFSSGGRSLTHCWCLLDKTTKQDTSMKQQVSVNNNNKSNNLVAKHFASSRTNSTSEIARL